MNDTHRSTPAFARTISLRTDLRNGELKGDGPHAQFARTTSSDSADPVESSPPAIKLETSVSYVSEQGGMVRYAASRLVGRDDVQLVGDGENPIVVWGMGGDMQFGVRASLLDGVSVTPPPSGRMSDGWTDVGELWLQDGAPRGDDYAAWEANRKPGHVAPDGSIWSHDGPGRWSSGIVGLAEGQREAAEAAGWGVSKDGRTATKYSVDGAMPVRAEPLDPSPEEQRERFERLAREPAPTATQVKVALENLDKHARGFAQFEYHGHALELNNAACVLDSLAAHKLAIELDRDDLRAQLDRIADQAKPLDGADVAELVQQARTFADGRERAGGMPNVAVVKVIRDLVAALNDQARKLAALEPAGDDMDTTIEAARLAIIGSVAGKEPAEAWNLIASRLRYFLIEERKAHRKAEAALETARGLIAEAAPVVEAHERIVRDGWSYSYDQRERAATVLRLLSVRGMVANPNSYAGTSTDGERYGDTVDAVAKALGMRRAEA